ncbi:universal stress protein [Dyella nitratireducens]|uniref:universal stress protein n=1 Tax=Dyella nitratireducens TaxID=1849580 RepID=UPI0016636FEF|nr:universal stress protein [Dyella nitratireducens]GLQ42153.1 universal stress protein [Dyella nitratireducens]
MFKRILLPTDGSELSLKAIRLGLNLAKTCNASVVALHAVPPVQSLAYMAEIVADIGFDYAKEATRFADRHLEDIRTMAEQAGVPFERLLLFGSQPYQAIVQTATDHHCDLIVMAAHSWEGLARLLMGSETHKVILKSQVPVLVCH